MKYEKIHASQSNKRSFVPCEGTLVNTPNLSNEYAQKYVQKLSAYRVQKIPLGVNSTKLGAQSKTKGLRGTYRKNRYNPEILTIVVIMKMTEFKRREKGISFKSFDRTKIFKIK